MKRIDYVLLVTLLLLSQTASATAPVFATATETQYARELKPPAGKVIVYIYQRAEDGAGVSPKIWLNNYEIGRLVPGSFTVWKMSPGQVELRVGDTDPATLSVVSQAGKTYLFHLSYEQTALGPKVQLEGLPESYRAELATSQLIKNPKQVTAVAAQAPAAPPPAKPMEQTAAPEQKAVKQSKSEPDAPLQAGGVSVLLKTGTYSLAETTQTILGTNRSFKDSASGLYAVEVDYQLDTGLTFGGELLGFKTTFTSVGLSDTHDVSVRMLMGTAKQYFRIESGLQPFLGVGVGAATTDVSGPTLSGSTFGLAYQLMAGVEYRSQSIGVFAEYKYVSASTEDNNSQKVDVSGSGIFGGVAFHF